MGKVLVDNLNASHTRECRSSDGLTIQIQPGARNVPIDEKFTWGLPADVQRSRAKVRVFETAEELKARQDAENKTRDAADKEEARLIADAEKADTQNKVSPPSAEDKKVSA